LGTPAAGNFPGGRSLAVSWTDSSGNFWLFGGTGYDSAGDNGNLNDFWEFDPSLGQWAWMDGNATESGCTIFPLGNIYCSGQPGVYGKLGTPQDQATTPGPAMAL
jgi:hypothetical protein